MQEKTTRDLDPDTLRVRVDQVFDQTTGQPTTVLTQVGNTTDGGVSLDAADRTFTSDVAGTYTLLFEAGNVSFRTLPDGPPITFPDQQPSWIQLDDNPTREAFTLTFTHGESTEKQETTFLIHQEDSSVIIDPTVVNNPILQPERATEGPSAAAAS